MAAILVGFDIATVAMENARVKLWNREITRFQIDKGIVCKRKMSLLICWLVSLWIRELREFKEVS